MASIDTRIPTPLNVKRIIRKEKGPMESTVATLNYILGMEIGDPIFVGDPDMYRFLYNVGRLRKHTLPNEFKIRGRGKSYRTLILPELKLLFIIRVK